MVTAREIVTDDRWALAAAVSRRTRIKTSGFCPNIAPLPCCSAVPPYTTMLPLTPLLFYVLPSPVVPPCYCQHQCSNMVLCCTIVHHQHQSSTMLNIVHTTLDNHIFPLNCMYCTLLCVTLHCIGNSACFVLPVHTSPTLNSVGALSSIKPKNTHPCSILH